MQQYSIVGLMREKYAAVLVDSLPTRRFLLKKTNILFPFLIVWSMCLFYSHVGLQLYTQVSSEIVGCQDMSFQ